jgi:hypothetical protein
MARSKQYNEQEVLEKSNVFVLACNGYENTSVRMWRKKWESTSFRFTLVC